MKEGQRQMLMLPIKEELTKPLVNGLISQVPTDEINLSYSKVKTNILKIYLFKYHYFDSISIQTV